MYDMLKNMDPPLGFGSKCPDRLAFKKLIRMNQPIDDEGMVHFTTTLFALIRENLRDGPYINEVHVTILTLPAFHQPISKCWVILQTPFPLESGRHS